MEIPASRYVGDETGIPREKIHQPPTHPGRVIRLELEEWGMTITEVNESQSVSPEMAMKLGRFVGNGTELWLNMQNRFDQWQIEHDRDALRTVERVEPVGG